MPEVRKFSDPAMAERFAAVMAGNGELVCGAVNEDHEGLTCARKSHPHEADNVQSHIGLVDGSPVQWTAVIAAPTMPKADRAPGA